MTVFWLYFYDLQGEKSVESRNEFIATFFLASLGRFSKQRKAGFLARFYQLFSKTFNIRFEISGKESYVMAFQMKKKEVTMEVRRAEESDVEMLTVTLDDMDYSHNAISMSDANGLMFFFEKDAPWYLRVRQFVYCLPLLGRTVSTLFKVLWNMGRRYLVPSPVVKSASPVVDGFVKEKRFETPAPSALDGSLKEKGVEMPAPPAVDESSKEKREESAKEDIKPIVKDPV
jgi:hypothetical protein